MCVTVETYVQLCVSARSPSPSDVSCRLTDAFCAGVARLETFVAFAAVTAHSVHTAAVLTKTRLGAALVQVCQRRRAEEESEGGRENRNKKKRRGEREWEWVRKAASTSDRK